MELLNIEGTCWRHFDAVTTTTQCLRPAPFHQPIGMRSITMRTKPKQQDASLEFCRILLPPIDHVTFSNLRAGSFEHFCLVLRARVCV